MTTKHPRLNVTLEEEYLGLIAQLADRQKQSVSATARGLILQALELQEDMYFSTLSEKRLKEAKTTISHADAWK